MIGVEGGDLKKACFISVPYFPCNLLKALEGGIAAGMRGMRRAA
jgi:hypothetical protein